MLFTLSFAVMLLICAVTMQSVFIEMGFVVLAKPKPKNTPPILKQRIVLNVAQLKD